MSEAVFDDIPSAVALRRAEVARVLAQPIAGVGRHQPRSRLDHLYPFGYNLRVYQLRQTDTFAKWLKGLTDLRAQARILARLESVRLGNLGDWKSVGSGIREMRIHTGPGYRLYYLQRKERILLLLCGGSKSSQGRDIAKAKRIALEIDEDLI